MSDGEQNICDHKKQIKKQNILCCLLPTILYCDLIDLVKRNPQRKKKASSDKCDECGGNLELTGFCQTCQARKRQGGIDLRLMAGISPGYFLYASGQ